MTCYLLGYILITTATEIAGIATGTLFIVRTVFPSSKFSIPSLTFVFFPFVLAERPSETLDLTSSPISLSLICALCNGEDS